MLIPNSRTRRVLLVLAAVYVVSFLSWKFTALNWCACQGYKGYFFLRPPEGDPERYAEIERAIRAFYAPLIFLDIRLIGGTRLAEYPDYFRSRNIEEPVPTAEPEV